MECKNCKCNSCSFKENTLTKPQFDEVRKMIKEEVQPIKNGLTAIFIAIIIAILTKGI